MRKKKKTFKHYGYMMTLYQLESLDILLKEDLLERFFNRANANKSIIKKFAEDNSLREVSDETDRTIL